MADLTKISFSSLSLEKMNRCDGLKEPLSVNSQAQKSHRNRHMKN